MATAPYLSTCFFTPFCFSEAPPPFKGTHTKSLSGGRLTNYTNTTGIRHQSRKYSDGVMTSSSRNYQCSIFISTRQHLKTVFCHFSNCFSGSERISGYWVGPDIEDGCGFVEAYVHQSI